MVPVGREMWLPNIGGHHSMFTLLNLFAHPSPGNPPMSYPEPSPIPNTHLWSPLFPWCFDRIILLILRKYGVLHEHSEVIMD
jgi:hypothetical protein